MAIQRFKLRLGVHLLLIKEDKILLLRRFNTGYMDGNYSLIAGHIDGNETVRSAAIREAKEEAGVDINENDLTFLHAMHRLGNSESLDLFFNVKKWKGEPKNTEPERCDDMRLFPLDKLPENTVPYIRFAIKNIQDNISYSEYEWERGHQ